VVIEADAKALRDSTAREDEDWETLTKELGWERAVLQWLYPKGR